MSARRSFSRSSSLSSTMAGTSFRAAILAARQRRSPETNSYRPTETKVTRRGCLIPFFPTDAASSSILFGLKVFRG
jgi:hypothetical protein